MFDIRLPKINWIAVSAFVGVVGVGVTIYFQFWGPPGPIAIINPSTDPSVLTAKIKSFPYSHAEADIFEREEAWREQWLQPLENELKERDIAPEVLETVVAVLEDMMNKKMERDVRHAPYSIARAKMWYSVTIRNDGDIPLRGVFLKFPPADFWINERGQLARVPEHIEIGDMDQKSEEWFTFWGNRLGSFSGDEKGVLGHSNGIGTIDFE